MTASFRALVNAFLSAAIVLPKTAAPSNPELSRQCRENIEQLTAPLRDDPSAESIEAVGKVVVKQVEDIARSNQAAVDDFDRTMKDVVATVAAAISGFKGHGQRHESSLTKLADGFDALAKVEDIVVLRHRLREDVCALRQSVAEMRRESQESAQQFEARITGFQERLEAARKGTDIDRLTMLGNRRVAERRIQGLSKSKESVCLLLFDVHGFGKINEQFGAPFGDKILQSLTHLLRESYPQEDGLFRWGADEFLAIHEGSLSGAMDRCRAICSTFANCNYVTPQRGGMAKVSASVAWGAVQYSRQESAESLTLHLRESLERNQREAK